MGHLGLMRLGSRIPRKLAIPSLFFTKNLFSDVSRKWILPNMTREGTAKSHLAKSTSWYHQKMSFSWNKHDGITSFQRIHGMFASKTMPNNVMSDITMIHCTHCAGGPSEQWMLTTAMSTVEHIDGKALFRIFLVANT